MMIAAEVTAQPNLSDVSAIEALKEIKQFWPFLLRSGINSVSAVAMSYIIAQKDLELLGAYAAYQAAIYLSIGFLYSSIFPVATLMSEAKGEEEGALTNNNNAAVIAAQEKIRAIWRQGIIFAALLSIPAVAFGLTASPIFKLFKQPDVVVENSQLYLAYATAGFVADIFYRLTARTVSGLGVKKSILIADGFDNLIELGIAYAFLNGKFGMPDLGIGGVGLAYTISKFITLFLHTAYMFFSPRCFGFDYTQYHLFQCSGSFFNKKIFKQLVSAGIPDGLSSVSQQTSIMVVAMFCGQSGTAPLVGIQTASVYNGFASFHMSAVLNAACNRIGRYFDIIKDDKNKYTAQTKMQAAKNVKTYAKLLMSFCIAISLVACGLTFLIPRQLATVIIDENNSAHQAHLSNAIAFLKIQGVFQVILGLKDPLSCVLEALLDNRFVSYATIIFDLISASAAAIAHYGLHKNADWTYAASGSGAVLMAVVLLCRCYSKLRVTANAESVDVAHAGIINESRSESEVPTFAQQPATTAGIFNRLKQRFGYTKDDAEQTTLLPGLSPA